MKFRRWLWLIIALSMVFGLIRLRLDTEVLHLLPGNLPEVRGLKLWQENFGGSRDLLITFRGTDPDGAAQVAGQIGSALREQKGLTGQVYWQAPWREHPGEVSEIAAAAWLNSAPEDVRKLVERLRPEQVETQMVDLRTQLSTSLSPADIGRLSYDPLQLLDIPSLRSAAGQFAADGPPFASADGLFRVIHVETPTVFRDYRAATEWLDQVRHVVRNAVAVNGSTNRPAVHFTGGPVFLSEISRDMERDMKRSVTGTAILVAAMFYFVHRRFKPLLWLIALLAFVLLATMAAGGLLFGHLNVVSMGFAAILLGLAVDYGLVVYQERLAHREESLREVLRATAPGIWWSAITTAGAFALLNFGGLPGLAQLGSLVAVGIMAAAAVMVGWFLKPLEASLGRPVGRPIGAGNRASTLSPDATQSSPWKARGVLFTTVSAGVLSACWVDFHPPGIDASSEPLRPARSPAYDAMDEMRAEIGGHDTWAILVTGTNEQVVADRLAILSDRLEELRSTKKFESAVLPGALWPNPSNQAANRALIGDLVNRWSAVTQAVEQAGFTPASLTLANGVAEAWLRALDHPGTYWPDNSVSHWILREMSARENGLFIAAGAIKPGPKSSGDWADSLQTDGVYIAGWERLGPALLNEVETRLKWVLAGIILVVVGSLVLTFRNLMEVALSVAALILSSLVLLAIMSLAGWSWNLMNLMAVPLLLGSTVDYSIHTQLSLRRHRGDPRATFAATGRAVLLCAATTAAGFGSLAMSSNAGLASLGGVCAVGAGCAALTACFLLPRWWQWVGGADEISGKAPTVRTPSSNEHRSKPAGPSRFYAGIVWKLGMIWARILPLPLARRCGRALLVVYACVARSRRRVVVENLLPVCGGELSRARRAAGRLFANFGLKLADLLRYESGRPVDALFRALPAPGQFAIDKGKGCGTLLLTVHLGNWEFGAPLLRRIGVQLFVLTLAEPGHGFTELREAARRRWGVETLVIGRDAFAFVEVLKRLQDGAVIALLIDRPPVSSSVEVRLFDRPFSASVAAAELARACGCRLLPVAIPWTPAGYEVISLPEVDYDRTRLGTREARHELTQEIVRAFEPVIRQHPDQWFHFVPIWN